MPQVYVSWRDEGQEWSMSSLSVEILGYTELLDFVPCSSMLHLVLPIWSHDFNMSAADRLAASSGLLGERGVCVHSCTRRTLCHGCETSMSSRILITVTWPVIRRCLLLRFLCLLEHTTNTAATVSWWTTCASLSFCGFMGENNKEVMHEAQTIVDKQTKQTVHAPVMLIKHKLRE